MAYFLGDQAVVFLLFNFSIPKKKKNRVFFFIFLRRLTMPICHYKNLSIYTVISYSETQVKEISNLGNVKKKPHITQAHMFRITASYSNFSV